MHGKPNRYRIRPADAYDWAQQFEATRTYLSKLNGDRRRKSQYLYFYCQWTQFNPDELIKLKMNNDPQHYVDAERLLDRFCNEEIETPDSEKWAISNAVRGMYTKNYHRLEQAGKVEYTVQKNNRSLSKEERFALYKACYTPQAKIMLMIPLCSAIALETMSFLNFEMFEPDWMRQEIPHIMIPGQFIKGHNKGKYKGTKQLTFITPECKRELVEYREWYTKTFGYIWRRNSPVILDVGGQVGRAVVKNGISKDIYAIAKRAGVKFGIHDSRTIVQTALENAGCPNNWIKKVKGRKCTGEEAPYSQPAIEKLRLMYQRALPELQFLGSAFRSDTDFTDEEMEQVRLLLKAVADGNLVLKK